MNLTADDSEGEAPAGGGSDSEGSLDDLIVHDSDPDEDAPDGSGSAAPAANKTKGVWRVGGGAGSGGAGDAGKGGKKHKGGVETGADEGRDSVSDEEARLCGELFGLVSGGDAAGLSGFLEHHPTAARWSGPAGLEGAAGVPALHWAVMQRQSDCVELLTEAGAQVSLPR
jgi:hypothetical protein